MKDDLGDRMKEYESISKHSLMKKTPVIIRIDGKAFHTFTKGMQRLFDWMLHKVMVSTAEALVRHVN